MIMFIGVILMVRCTCTYIYIYTYEVDDGYNCGLSIGVGPLLDVKAPWQAVKARMQRFDARGKLRLYPEELKALMQSLGLQFSEEQLEAMITITMTMMIIVRVMIVRVTVAITTVIVIRGMPSKPLKAFLKPFGAFKWRR